jgi:hypothetical protein
MVVIRNWSCFFLLEQLAHEIAKEYREFTKVCNYIINGEGQDDQGDGDAKTDSNCCR